MEQLYLVILIVSSTSGFAQIPANYFDATTGTGFALKTQLFTIINDTNDGLYRVQSRRFGL